MKLITLFLISISLIFSGCAIIKNQPQESKFMKVTGGGKISKLSNGGEEKYGITVDFKELPSNAKYLIAHFELPNNPGFYEKKVYPLKGNEHFFSVQSNQIYVANFGLYYVKLYLSEDQKGERIIDKLEQSVKLYPFLSKGRDHATQYTLFENSKEIKKILVIYPNKIGKRLISADISNQFKIGYASITPFESIIEYVPNNETVYKWTKIITLREDKVINQDLNKPSIQIAALGNAFYKKFSEFDKDIKIAYAGIYDGNFINSDDPNFSEKIKDSNEVGVYIDYADYLTVKKYPYQREYLVVRAIKSDIAVWEFQCTVRYDKRWKSEKIEKLKKEARDNVASFQYVNSDPTDNLELIALENGINNFYIETQRLDDRDLNEKFKSIVDSPYKKD